MCLRPDADTGIERCWEPDRMRGDMMRLEGETGTLIELESVEYVLPSARRPTRVTIPRDQPGPALGRVREVRKSYETTEAVAGVSLTIAPGEFVALVGASGSGKSTLLKTVNRLVDPSGGTVLFEGEPVESLPLAALRRQIGYVFQSIGLFPHMTVGENIAIGPRLVGERLPEGRIARLLELVELDPAMAVRLPDELSGGQRQRVGVARARPTIRICC